MYQKIFSDIEDLKKVGIMVIFVCMLLASPPTNSLLGLGTESVRVGPVSLVQDQRYRLVV